MCWLARVSRASYYRTGQAAEPDAEEMELRDAIQRIALGHRSYGYRRVTAQLRRDGRVVNHKRVARLLREDNLLALRRRKFRPPTTDSQHALRVYLNLAARMTLSGPNQLWVADITYIRLRSEFVYLAVILDAWSRKVIGWRLSRSLQSEFAVEALRQALESRRPAASLVHHSDRGIHYACGDYQKLLDQHGILSSMSRAGNPYDNAACESFMKTLKSEEVDGATYSTLEQLQQNLASFLDQYYNQQRLHSSLDYRTPEEFDGQPASSQPQAARLEFSKAWGESIHPMTVRTEPPEPRAASRWSAPESGEPRDERSACAHRLDEFPAEYSSAGCSPAEPASASSTELSMPQNQSVDDDSSANGNLSLSALSQQRGSPHLDAPSLPIQQYVDHYNTVRLHGAIGFVTPADMLAGRQKEIQDARDCKLEEARRRGNYAVNRQREKSSYNGSAR